MQFITTVFEAKNQTVENKTFQTLTVEQHLTAVCDKCDFVLSGTKDDLKHWITTDELTLCDSCSF